MEGHLDAVIAARAEVSALLEAKQEQRAALDAELADLATEIADLATEVEVFSRYIARHNAAIVAAPSTEADRWRDMARTDAIMAALHTMNAPGSPSEISDHLRSMGRTDNPAEVSRALNRLKEQSRAMAVVRGLWAPVERTGDQRPRQEAPATSLSEDSDAPESSDKETPTTEAGGDERYALHHDHRASVNGRHGDSDHQTPIMRAVR